MARVNDPTQAEVRYVPETGNKRPWEVWLRSGHGAWYQRGSFASEQAANAKVTAVAKMFDFQDAENKS